MSFHFALVFLKRSFVLGFTLGVLCGCTDKNNDQALQAMLDETITEGVPGISVAIADKNGIIWTGVAGHADIKQDVLITDDHLFGIGSITKPFITVIIMQLVEENRLSLEDTAQDILGTDVVGEIAGADIATLAQLLNHTGGVPSWEDDPIWIKEGRGAALDVTKTWGRKDTLSYLKQTPALHEAGEKFSYANTNYTLLGLIIEKVTGNDVVLEIRNRILTPVGISDIFLEGFEPLPKTRLTNRYHYLTPEFKREAGVHDSFSLIRPDLMDVSTSNLSVEWVAGGMVATATDLAKFAYAFHDGKLLSPKSMAFVEEWMPVSKGMDFGHGLFRITPKESPSVIGHTGGVLGYSAVLYWFEAEDIAVVAFTNVGTMHIKQRRPNASTLAFNKDFMEQVLNYAETRRN